MQQQVIKFETRTYLEVIVEIAQKVKRKNKLLTYHLFLAQCVAAPDLFIIKEFELPRL